MHFQKSLQDQLLIAMPQQHDKHFNESVIYICEHNEDGAMGLIINKPLPIDFAAISRQMGIKTSREQQSPLSFMRSVFYGGPCQSDHGFILHTGGGDWSSTIEINNSVYLTSSKEILFDIAKLKGPEHYLLALGYAGWESGQLETEMRNNIWLNVEANPDTIFTLAPTKRWTQAAASIGIDMNLLSQDIGIA